MSKPAFNRAVLYLRFSPRPGAEYCESIKTQRQRCLAYCKAHGLRVTKADIIKDANLSGGTTNKRRIKEALRRCIKRKRVLVVTDLDRISRNTLDALRILSILTKRKIPLVMLDNNIDTTTDPGYMQYILTAMFAEQHRRDIQRKTRTAMQGRRNRGWSMGSVPPYGFKFGPTLEVMRTRGPCQRKTLVPEPAEQAAIVVIRKLHYVEDRTYTQIAKALNELGHRMRGDSDWKPYAVWRIVQRIKKDDAAGLRYDPDWVTAAEARRSES